MKDSYDSARINDTPSIQSFLARPIKFADYTFSSSNTVTTFAPIAHPSDLVAPTLISNKLKGIQYIRATSVFTLFVNATKFQAGRYILAHCPTGGANMNSSFGADWYNQHRFSMTQISQLPHVELDISCETQATLKIPFSSVENNYSMTSTGGWTNVGYVFVVPYGAFATGSTGSSNCAASLYHHFEDVVLQAPTIPQSASWKPTNNQKESVPSSEQKENDLGPISGALSHASRALGFLGKIPTLSVFTGPAEWWLNLSAGVAKQFGWSRPTDLSPENKVFRRLMPGLANSDVPDHSQVIAPFSTNELPMAEGISIDQDELSFEFIKAIPSYFARADWTTAQASATPLVSFDVTPGSFFGAAVDATVDVKNHSPISFISSGFNLWRGSIVVAIKLVKTSFHSGRLAMGFIPIDDRFADPTVTLDALDYVNRTIVDIRDGNEIVIAIPYVATSSWLKTTEKTGAFYIYVLDELVAPASVSSTIELLIEVKGGSDFEVAVPIERIQIPYVPTAPQSGDWAPTECSLIEDTIGSASIQVSNIHSALTIGESVRSFRSLLKMPTKIMTFNNVDDIPVGLHISPFVIPTARNSASAVVTPYERPDIYGLLGSIYMYSRGSVRIKTPRLSDTAAVIPNNQSIAHLRDIPTHTIGSVFNSGTFLQTVTNDRQLPMAYSDDSVGGFQIQVPNYSKYHSRNNAEFASNTVTARTFADGHGPSTIVEVRRQRDGSTAQHAQRFRSGADDCNFSYFVSIPPMYTPLFTQ